VYNFGQVQRTSQVERKTKCLQKNNGWGYSRPLDCLVKLALILTFNRLVARHKGNEFVFFVSFFSFFVFADFLNLFVVHIH